MISRVATTVVVQLLSGLGIALLVISPLLVPADAFAQKLPACNCPCQGNCNPSFGGDPTSAICALCLSPCCNGNQACMQACCNAATTPQPPGTMAQYASCMQGGGCPGNAYCVSGCAPNFQGNCPSGTGTVFTSDHPRMRNLLL
jgi:hypothetical protein